MQSPNRSRNKYCIPARFGLATTDKLRQNVAVADAEWGTGTPGTNLSWMVLVCPTTLTSLRWICARDNAGSTGHGIQVSGTAGATICTISRAVTATPDTYTTSAVLKVNKWTWLAFVRDTAATNILQGYVGSITEGMHKDTGTAVNGTGVLDSDVGLISTIGNSYSTGSPALAFQGMIAFYARWKRAITLKEMLAIQFGYLEECPRITDQLLELVNPGDRGIGRTVPNYGKAHGEIFVFTTSKGVGQGGIPQVPFMGQNRRRFGRVPVGGVTVLPRRTLLGVGI